MADRVREVLEADYRRLVESEYQFVYRLLFWLSKDRAAAEDLTQVTFIRAWEALPKRRCSAASDRAWLAKIARNAATDHSRRVSSAPLSPLNDEELRAGLPGVAETVIAQLEEAALMRAVLALPETYRTALVLTRVEALSTAEAAQALGVPRGTVKWRVHRALALLRQRLSETDPHSPGTTLETLHATPKPQSSR